MRLLGCGSKAHLYLQVPPLVAQTQLDVSQHGGAQHLAAHQLARAQTWAEAIIDVARQHSSPTSASKTSIRRFVITEKAPTKVIRDGRFG